MIDLQLEQVGLRQGAFRLSANGRFRAETLGISGKSAGGKTSFLELIAGLRRPDQGRVILNGVVLDDAESKLHVEARARRIGYVAQDADLFPHLGVRDNLLFGSSRADAGGPDFGAVVSALALDSLLGRSGKGLSGGERRRVALGRALLSGPSLLVLDEPFAGLDEASRRGLRRNLKVLHGFFRIPWILVSHDRSDLRGLCGRTLSIRDGALF
ncbi:MAG TPA: ATP-binding cassette domain-containing protein [bacterium]|nr:ATP-binding cassette domain-containing protein [bacterium]